MPVDSTPEVWSRFTEFECAVGDLSGVIKVEKRRGNALREVTDISHMKLKTAVYHFGLQELKGNWAVLLVDRYKYLNLFPCNNTELLSMGYPVSYPIIPNSCYVFQTGEGQGRESRPIQKSTGVQPTQLVTSSTRCKPDDAVQA